VASTSLHSSHRNESFDRESASFAARMRSDDAGHPYAGRCAMLMLPCNKSPAAMR
jgi:hypothetical protein